MHVWFFLCCAQVCAGKHLMHVWFSTCNNDGGKHFCNKLFEKLMKRNASGQTETSKRQIKGILEKIVQPSQKDWSNKLNDIL